jgi:hypothetical protein
LLASAAREIAKTNPGRRLYNHPGAGRWIWNYNFSPTPGEFYFDEDECKFAIRRSGILIEPNVPWQKSVAVNKDWGIARWQMLADHLRFKAGLRVFQTSYGKRRLAGVEVIEVKGFRRRPRRRSPGSTSRSFRRAACIMPRRRSGLLRSSFSAASSRRKSRAMRTMLT